MTEHRFQGYAHPELYKMINSGPGVAASIPVEQGWKQIAATLAQIDGDLHEGLAKMGADWESDASDTAQGALSPLAEWAGFAESGATTMESSARLQGEFVAEARKKMPEVVPVTTEKPGMMDMAVGALTGPVGMAHVVGQQMDHERQEAAADNAAAQAVKVMEDYQSDSRWNSSTLGEFPTPPQVVIDTPPPAGTGTGSAGPGSHSPTGYTPSGNAGNTGNTGTTNPSWTPPPAQTTPPPSFSTWTPPTDTTHTSWTQPPSTPPVHTPPTNLPQPIPAPTPTPAPMPPGGPVFTRPTTSGPGGGSGGGPGSGGARGGQPGAPGGKAFGPMSGSLGTSGQGSGMKPGGLPGMSGLGSGPDALRGGMAGGAGAGAGKAGAAGAGMGAGGAHGRKGEGEDDIEHKAADYLVETDDVFGDERMVAPPVIGGFSE
ncbi:PPE family protein [Lentzea xinjiangensis]|uniref:PPE family protein n=1 Tax=Lentzea xinjiangensis TaxID=402600 RepID=A0A1H9AN03_9PSEU|nr:PPE domain-containing protein [Lentzea xinjiangensis]SEP77935.1 PPE family protein [Lentzea xinjiangensis]